MRPYTLLARYYDSFFTFHLTWYLRARESLLGKILPRVSSACDLACGTGTTALELARRGIKVFAVELSPTMCRLAREKARRARIPMRVLRGDMRTFRLPEPVDLILCEFDALNHVQVSWTEAEIRRTLGAAGFDLIRTQDATAFFRGDTP